MPPTRRRWIKLYPVECLDGSIRYQLEPDERGAWYDLLSFAAICSNDGTIADRSGRPFPYKFIANRLNITLDLLERTLEKCKEEGRLSENGSGIHIVNWSVYQSEYDRQKPYREKQREEERDEKLKRQNKIYHALKAKAKELRRELTPDERQAVIDGITEGLS